MQHSSTTDHALCMHHLIMTMKVAIYGLSTIALLSGNWKGSATAFTIRISALLFSNTKSEHEYGMNLDFASASKTLATRKTKTSCMEEARVALQSYQK